MPETCTIDPARECRSSTRLALLEQRVEDLEDGQRKESTFRESYYADQRDRIRRDEQMDAKLDALNSKVEAIGGKMDKLALWQDEQQQKPGKRWDGLVDKLIWGVVGAVLAFLLGRFGL